MYSYIYIYMYIKNVTVFNSSFLYKSLGLSLYMLYSTSIYFISCRSRNLRLSSQRLKVKTLTLESVQCIQETVTGILSLPISPHNCYYLFYYMYCMNRVMGNISLNSHNELQYLT